MDASLALRCTAMGECVTPEPSTYTTRRVSLRTAWAAWAACVACSAPWAP